MPDDPNDSTSAQMFSGDESWLSEWAMLGIFELEELLVRAADFRDQLRRDLPRGESDAEAA